MSGNHKKPRGWYLYLREAVCIANSRGVSKGVGAPPKKKSRQVTGYIVTDPVYVDYNPPKEEPSITDYMKFNHNPFEELDTPKFTESSSVEEPADACKSKVLHRR